MPHWSHPSVYAAPRTRGAIQHRPSIVATPPGALFQIALAEYAAAAQQRASVPTPAAWQQTGSAPASYVRKTMAVTRHLVSYFVGSDPNAGLAKLTMALALVCLVPGLALAGVPATGGAEGSTVTVVPASPIGAALIQTLTPTLTWRLSAPATGVTFEVRYRNKTDRQAYPTTPQGRNLSALTFRTAQLEGGKLYEWQVRVCEARVCADKWSADATFEVNAALTTPVKPIISYPTGNVLIYGASARLSWYAPGTPDGTEFVAYVKACAEATCRDELRTKPTANNAGFTAFDTDGVANTTFTPATAAPGYVWYVRSGLGTKVSDASVFGSFRFAVSAARTTTVVLIAPASAAEITTLAPRLQWNVQGSATGVTGYEIRWGTRSDPERSLGTGTTSASTRAFTIPTTGAGALNWGTTYYWHVRPAGATAWVSSSFKTALAIGTAVPTPTAPTALAVITGTTATLQWFVNGSTGIASYQIELFQGKGKANKRSFTVSAPNLRQAVTGLVPGASYRWHIRSSPGGTAFSDWSDYAQFTMAAGKGSVVPVAESPAEGVMISEDIEGAVLSWSMPVESESPLTFDVEIASSEDMAGARVYADVVSAEVVLAQLPAGTHFWRVRSKTAEGDFSEFSDAESFTIMTATAIEGPGATSPGFRLEAVYPNPIAQQGTVRFAVPEPAQVHLSLFDLLGREVAVLVDRAMPAGAHSASIDATGVAPGLYVVRMTARGFSETRPLIVGR